VACSPIAQPTPCCESDVGWHDSVSPSGPLCCARGGTKAVNLHTSDAVHLRRKGNTRVAVDRISSSIRARRRDGDWTRSENTTDEGSTSSVSDARIFSPRRVMLRLVPCRTFDRRSGGVFDRRRSSHRDSFRPRWPNPEQSRWGTCRATP